jgi:hypothetical protein
MKSPRKSQAPVKVELSGNILDSISRILCGAANFVEVLFLSLTRIVVALTDMVVRRLQRY